MTEPIPSRVALTVLLVWGAAPQARTQEPRVSIEVVKGLTEDGLATDQWLAMLARRLPSAQYDSVARIRKPLTSDERAWAELVRSRIPAFAGSLPGLSQLFQPARPPAGVRVVLGNRGAEDAFTHDPTTIGFDLAALQASYGPAAAPGNPERIDRFLRHEFVHLMQKAWFALHPWSDTSPLGAALAEIWAEGLGNYQSLSDRWFTRDGQRSEATTRALAELEPRLVARLAALACTGPKDAARLTADLSWGRFDRKWGALTAALWLEELPGDRGTVLRRFIVAGPAGVWDLADRSLSEPLGAVLREARAAHALCRNGIDGP